MGDLTLWFNMILARSTKELLIQMEQGGFEARLATNSKLTAVEGSS